VTPIALTDDQITSIMQLAAPLSPADRVRFLQLIAERLRNQDDVGDGSISRLCRELQRQFFTPPSTETARGSPRHLKVG
jgi:hypothetical protein